MAIQLKPETERLVQEKLESGEFQSVDEIIEQGIQAGRGKRQAQGSEAERRAAVSPARSLEQEWLKHHAADYAGSWVALEGARVVAHGSSAPQVLEAAKAEGFEQPLVVHVPSERELPFGGW
jgi:Arc/MetJ-type ribon-helix-helix transcriptional regulator